MRKICLVLPSLAGGGMERVMIELSKQFLAKPGTEVHLVLLGKSKKFYQIPFGITLTEPNFSFNDGSWLVHALRTLKYFRKTIKTFKPDVILSFGEIWNNFVLLSLIGLKIPIFVSDRCNPQKSIGLLHDTLRRVLYKRAAGVIAQTEKAKQIFDDMKLNPVIKVIGNPVRNMYNPGIKKEKIVLSVGRLIKSKNFDRLIEVFYSINDPEWQLIIIGGDVKGGNNRGMLREKVSGLNGTDRIKLLGQISNVEEYYNKASIFAFMSVSEGFPNVVGEAMSVGLAVVAYDCVAGPSDMIEDGINGYLINEDDEVVFSEKLKELMKNEELRDKFGSKARESILKYSAPSIGEKFYNLLGVHN